MNTIEFHNKCVKGVKEKIEYHELLLKHTNKTVKKNEHKIAIQHYKNVLEEIKNETYEIGCPRCEGLEKHKVISGKLVCQWCGYEG